LKLALDTELICCLARSIHQISDSSNAENSSNITINDLENEIFRIDSVADFQSAGDTCFKENLFLPAKLLYTKTSFTFKKFKHL
jgi:hypothetical protein